MGNRFRDARTPDHANPYGKECAAARRFFNRKLRRQEKRAVERGDDALPRRRGTQGWLTW